MSELVKLLTGSSIEVNRLASLLDDNNIQHLIKNNEESARVAGFGIPLNSVELHVNKSDLEKAQKIVADFENDNQD